jgi:rhodanese-related sulfurtransferase
MPIANRTAPEAHEQQQRGATLVDVRSTREYNTGHAAGAVNVPLMEPDEDTGQMTPNPDFVRVMQANFAADTPLLLACQGGGRSARAARMLETFGYSNITNVLGGFLGKRDPVDGRTIDPGWHECGLPTDTTPAPGGSYAELIAKADAAK